MEDNKKDNNLVEIGERLQQIRRKLKLKQKEFAKELEISAPNLSEIEAGNAKPRYELIYNITKKFNVNIYYLLHGKGEMFVMLDKVEQSVKERQSEEEAEFFQDLFYYFEASPMVKYNVMLNFRQFLIDNDKSIEKDIAIHKDRKERKKK